MTELKYKVIKTKRQYFQYCNWLEELLSKQVKSTKLKDEIELLTALVEKWDRDHMTLQDADPVSLIKSLMKEHNMKAQDLVDILGVSKGLVSDILNYKKGLSKESVRKLASHFALSQEALNRPYRLTAD